MECPHCGGVCQEAEVTKCRLCGRDGCFREDGGCLTVGMIDRGSPEQLYTPAKLAKLFHETYERLAPEHGYKTRAESAVPWDDVPENNKALMIATCHKLLEHLDQVNFQSAFNGASTRRINADFKIEELEVRLEMATAVIAASNKILRGMVFTRETPAHQLDVEWHPMCLEDASHKDDKGKSAWDELTEALAELKPWEGGD